VIWAWAVWLPPDCVGQAGGADGGPALTAGLGVGDAVGLAEGGGLGRATVALGGGAVVAAGLDGTTLGCGTQAPASPSASATASHLTAGRSTLTAASVT
jgi:hypothetical protein